jgi:hypothetical protein
VCQSGVPVHNRQHEEGGRGDCARSGLRGRASEHSDGERVGGHAVPGGIDPSVRKFIEGLDPALVKQVTLFSTGFEEKAVAIMKDLLARRGVVVTDKCYVWRGKFLLFNRTHPDAGDLTGAEEFARSVLAG